MKTVGALCVFAMCLGGTAAEISLLDREVRVPRGETRSFEFGTVPQQGTTVLLTVESRLDAKKLSGSMFFMRLFLNGHEIRAARSRSAVRLRNRSAVSPVAPNLPASWYGGSWRVLYAPDFAGGLKQGFYEGNPYVLVLDVTDMTNPAAENRLDVENVFPARHTSWAGTEGDLVLRRMVVETLPEPSPTMTAGSDLKPVINRGGAAAGPADFAAEVTVGGGVVLQFGGVRWPIISSFSYPDGGFNRLTPGPGTDTAGETHWRVTTEIRSDGAAVTAQGEHYSLHRNVRVTSRRVEVTDALTNRSDRDAVGLVVEHALSVPDASRSVVRLAGNPDPAIDTYYAPANPSVHIADGNRGLGMLCEDDVFRNQARLFCRDNGSTAGLRTEMLRLGPGETVTLRWAVYPVSGPDYYDFVNLVREDWGANFTVDGAWTFFNPDTILATPSADLRRDFRRLGIGYAVYCGGWVDRKHDAKRIGFGTGVMDDYWADFRERLRLACERIHEAVPDCKVLVYYDSQRDTSEGGHERFRDSWLTNEKGDQLSTEWSGRYSLTRSVVATLENTFGRAMLDVADRYLSDLAVDGLYWDEMENVAYGSPLLTFNQFDGHSCLLDPETHTIRCQVGVTTLLGKDHRLEVIRRVRAKGGVLMGNGPPTSLDMLRTEVPRMVEIQHNDVWCHEGDLSSPLGYASSRMDFGNWIRALGMAKLLVGTRYTYEHEISAYVFPFTPIELHHGYLLGKERIITIHSGSYGWPGTPTVPVVHHFNTDGKRTGQQFPTTVTDNGARTQVELSEGEAVVLERLPLHVQAVSGGTVTMTGASIADSAFSVTVSAPAGARIVLGNTGVFPMGAGSSYRVSLGEGVSRPLRPSSGRLAIEIPPGFEGIMRIMP